MTQSAEQVASGGFKYGAATMLVVGLTSTVAQFMAWASLGIADQISWRFSTGGVLAIVGGVVTWVTCRSWHRWRTQIWVWIAVTAVVAFVTVNLMSFSSQGPASVGPESPAPTAPSLVCQTMQNELVAKKAEVDRVASAPPGSLTADLNRFAGNHLEEEYDALYARYRAGC